MKLQTQLTTSLLVCALAGSAAFAARVKKKNGEVIEGQIKGTVVALKKEGSQLKLESKKEGVSATYVLVRGAEIQTIDESGIFVWSGYCAVALAGKDTVLDDIAVIRHTLRRPSGSFLVVNKAKDGTEVVILTFKPDKETFYSLRKNLPADWQFAEVISDANTVNAPLLGEYREEKGNPRLTPAIEMDTKQGMVTIPIEEIVAFEANTDASSEPLRDLSGDWVIRQTTPVGVLSLNASLKQEGESLSGTLKTASGNRQLQGTISGGKISLFYTLPREKDRPILVQLTGMVSGNRMSGTLQLDGTTLSPWTAGRIASAPAAQPPAAQPPAEAQAAPSPAQQADTLDQKPEAIENAVRQAMAAARADDAKMRGIIVQDAEGSYWSFDVDRIAEITGNRLVLKKGATFTKGAPATEAGRAAAEWTPQEIAEALTNPMGGFFFSTRKDKDGKEKLFAGVSGRATKEIPIVVKKLLSPAP
jgi:hypothetical protein